MKQFTQALLKQADKLKVAEELPAKESIMFLQGNLTLGSDYTKEELAMTPNQYMLLNPNI